MAFPRVPPPLKMTTVTHIEKQQKDHKGDIIWKLEHLAMSTCCRYCFADGGGARPCEVDTARDEDDVEIAPGFSASPQQVRSSHHFILSYCPAVLTNNFRRLICALSVQNFMFVESHRVAVWLSGNIVGRINEVVLRRAGLMLRWVKFAGILTWYLTKPPGSLSLAIPLRAGIM